MLDPALFEIGSSNLSDLLRGHPEDLQRPIGIAISTKTHRGKLIFWR